MRGSILSLVISFSMAWMTTSWITERTTSSPARLKPSLNSILGMMRADSEGSLVRKWVVMDRSVVPPPMSMEAMRTLGLSVPSGPSGRMRP